ncbi:hypothetical protein DSCA_61830 [Desulfosarcina alkanivorans]|jgi:hypothetical protein|uniref:Uncharacterized protein n=1 Tax=Desulfosarcina alkanivorans TaxID=571177 RepID=A0A5K7YW78_9BACT|nr:hypothetical protein [Desulfosarcina alkanivorans]BBO72253.1 hypothetical protein DSCA_61830 [Desulfosarcina alkanivorans]
MIADKKIFFMGSGLLVGFAVVFCILFMPIFGAGQNALNYFDNLFNSISKGSAYYIPDLVKKNEAFDGREVAVTIDAGSAEQAERTTMLLWKAGAAAEVDDTKVSLKGDLGRILAAGLEDADLLFHNRSEALQTKYGFDGREALYSWWNALKGMDKELKKQKQFENAAFVATVQAKAVEVAFNFNGIEPQNITDKIWIVIFALAFYIIYTLWFGFSIMYMFEGWGMELEH